ncbi:Uncharacterised protein [uncultured archaeon]|nr:Uncharacterised protein [uncultured archaeon]
MIENTSKRPDWSELSQNLSINDEFCENHLDELEWKYIFTNTSISFQFLAKHIDKIQHKQQLCRNRMIYDRFLDCFQTKQHLFCLSSNPALTPVFFERNLKRKIWSSPVYENSFVPQTKIDYFLDYLNN